MDEPDDYLFIAEELASVWLRSRRGDQPPDLSEHHVCHRSREALAVTRHVARSGRHRRHQLQQLSFDVAGLLADLEVPRPDERSERPVVAVLSDALIYVVRDTKLVPGGPLEEVQPPRSVDSEPGLGAERAATLPTPPVTDPGADLGAPFVFRNVWADPPHLA